MGFNPVLLFAGGTSVHLTAIYRTLVRSRATGGILHIAAGTVVGLGKTEGKARNEQNGGAERQNFIFHVVKIEWLEDVALWGIRIIFTIAAGGCHTEL